MLLLVLLNEDHNATKTPFGIGLSLDKERLRAKITHTHTHWYCDTQWWGRGGLMKGAGCDVVVGYDRLAQGDDGRTNVAKRAENVTTT